MVWSERGNEKQRQKEADWVHWFLFYGTIACKTRLEFGVLRREFRPRNIWHHKHTIGVPCGTESFPWQLLRRDQEPHLSFFLVHYPCFLSICSLYPPPIGSVITLHLANHFGAEDIFENCFCFQILCAYMWSAITLQFQRNWLMCSSVHMHMAGIESQKERVRRKISQQILCLLFGPLAQPAVLCGFDLLQKRWSTRCAFRTQGVPMSTMQV